MPGNFHSVPESVIASWPTPNYVDPVRRTWLPIVCGVLLGASTILITGRFSLRMRGLGGGLGYDDLFVSIGWLSSVGFAAVGILGTERYYLDRHTWDVPYTAYVGAARNGWIAQILFIISTAATKASILLFYRRMAKDAYNRRWRYAVYAALGFTFAAFVSILIAYCLLCQPLDAYWLSYDFTYDKPYKCVNGNILSPTVGAISIFGDLLATALPWAMLANYELEVPRKQKIALNVMFSLSLIVAGCGVGRTYYLWQINNTYDTSWTGFDLFLWSELECHLSVIFACAPALRVFFRRYLQPTYRSYSAGMHSRSHVRTKDSEISTQDASTVAPSVAVMNPTAKLDTIDEQHLVQDTDAKPATVSDSWSRRSSDTMPRVTNADEYETYNMRQLRRYGYQKSVASERTLSHGATTHDVQGMSWFNFDN